MGTETKVFPIEFKSVSEDGTFTGYASAFGNTDAYGDIVDAGAFAKTIKERKGVFPMLWQHNTSEPIGASVAMSEDKRGLLVDGHINLDVQRGREAYALLKNSPGALGGMSIGYVPIKTKDEGKIRRIQEIKLMEYSLVTFPANTSAVVTQVKSALDMVRDWALEHEGLDVVSDDVRLTVEVLRSLVDGEPDASTRDDQADTDDEPTIIVTRALDMLREHIKNGGTI